MSNPGDADDLLIRARYALLDALDALGAHRDSIVVIGAQAIYLHTAGAAVAVAEATRDSDLAIDPRTLQNEPLVEKAMERAGFYPDPEKNQPGAWLNPDGIPVDLMVPEAAAYEPLAADGTARAVANNVKAMERAIRVGIAGTDFTVEDLLDIHQGLLEGTSEARFAGIVRTDQNWIGGRGTSPADAAFVPPPPDRAPELLQDLVTFVNRDDLPAVAQAAVAHAQFETIHPFGDGNGRTGRCLIHVIFRRRSLTPLFVPPVSVVLAASARRYIAGLVDFREGRADDWIGSFADALSASAAATHSLWAEINSLLGELISRAGNPRSDSVARKIIAGLPAQPIVSAEIAADRYHVTPTAARAALNRLQEAGVVVQTRVGRRRDREWASEELFQLLDAFEYEMADQGTRPTRRPAPSPTRPPRNRRSG